jgi:hypothetical protein
MSLPCFNSDLQSHLIKSLVTFGLKLNGRFDGFGHLKTDHLRRKPSIIANSHMAIIIYSLISNDEVKIEEWDMFLFKTKILITHAPLPPQEISQ